MKHLILLIFSLFSNLGFAAQRPNILFIFADDWGWGDLSCHGHPYVKTPNIDRLAKEGTDFHRFTVASGVCSPSRTGVMTGHFPARYNIDGHFAWVPSNTKRGMPDWLDPSAVTIPKLLQKAGYATAHYGKWHLANDMIPDSPTPAEYGYDEYGANARPRRRHAHQRLHRKIRRSGEALLRQSLGPQTPYSVPHRPKIQMALSRYGKHREMPSTAPFFHTLTTVLAKS
jgi:hypothetical protein